MKTGQKGLTLIEYFETGNNLNKYLTAYWDATGKVWTIGIGSTYYEDGSKIKQGDKITAERARAMFANILPRYEKDVLRLVKKTLTQNQFDALVSFTYNVGASNLGKSTLLRKINVNPNDPSICDEFPKWNKSGGVVLSGLTRRRKAESDLYFSVEK